MFKFSPAFFLELFPMSFALVLTELFVPLIADHPTLTPSFGHKCAQNLQRASELSPLLPVLPHCCVFQSFHRIRVKSSFVWLEHLIICWRVGKNAGFT